MVAGAGSLWRIDGQRQSASPEGQAAWAAFTIAFNVALGRMTASIFFGSAM
jgi:hypothetical protein